MKKKNKKKSKIEPEAVENEEPKEKKNGLLPMEGTVVEAVRGAFRVKIDDIEHIALCHLGGKLRKHYIKVVPGDKVSVELTPYDLTKGRITYRHR